MQSNESTVTAHSAETDTTRVFSKTQWATMGENKAGWKIPNPDEAAAAIKTAAALAKMQADYKAATGKDAEPTDSFDYLRGVLAASGQTVAPEAPAAAAAAEYKRPRSTEDARSLYREVTGEDADEDATFTAIVAEIETRLGVGK